MLIQYRLVRRHYLFRHPPNSQFLFIDRTAVKKYSSLTYKWLEPVKRSKDKNIQYDTLVLTILIVLASFRTIFMGFELFPLLSNAGGASPRTASLRPCPRDPKTLLSSQISICEPKEKRKLNNLGISISHE